MDEADAMVMVRISPDVAAYLEEADIIRDFQLSVRTEACDVSRA